MKVIGIGTDLVDVRRIEKSVASHNGRFEKRVFTDQEIEHCCQKNPSCYAKRFAAKEACVKALGTGIAKGVSWQDINIFNDEYGKPHVEVTGEFLRILKEKIPKGYGFQIDLSMTDEGHYAQAFVVITTLVK